MNRCTAVLAIAGLVACASASSEEIERGKPYFDYPPRDQPMTVRCRPMQWLDGQFFLSEGDPSMFLFGFGNPSGTEPKDPHLMVALPDSVRVAGWHVTLKLEKSIPWEAGRTLHDFRLPRQASAYASPKGSAMSRGVSVLVVTEAKPETRLPDAVFWFRDGQREGLRSVLKLKVLPRIHARTPGDFKVGAMLRKPTFYLRGENLEKVYGEFVKRCGIGWVIAGRGAPTTYACKKAGIEVASEAGLANGYMLGWSMHPKDVAFYLATGERFKRAVCPTAVYTSHPYIEEHLYQKTIRKLIVEDRTCDHLTTNWEPYMFLSKGCFCDRCREEFIRWSKLPAAQIRKDWPLGVAKKQKAVWERFFAWQHGRVLTALEKMCQRAGREVGIDSHFFPQIACTQIDPSQKDEYYNRLTDIEQYVNRLRWIQLWGGYMTWDITAPRRRPIAGRLVLHQYAGMARTWADRHVRDGKRPIISWGHGTSLGTTAYTFPEAITFDILCCFLNGIDRTAGYVFPHGYDNRYWAAVAEAADTAVAFEPFVRNGKRLKRHSLEAVTPVPSVEAGATLRSFEFERDGRRLIAVGNFWRESETFFKLKLDGLPKETKYVLREPLEKRSFMSPRGQQYWTASELERGVLLHVGALRWVFFSIEPYLPAAVPPSHLSPASMAEAMKQRMPEIRKKREASMQFIAEARKARIGDAGDYGKLKALRVGDLTCSVRDINDDGKPEIIFARKREELVIEPSKGARVLHWKLDGFDVAYRLGPHSLAVDATWAPAHFVEGEVKVIEHKVHDGGMLLTTERVIPKAARGCLSDIKVTRTLVVPEKTGSFRVTTRLTNSGNQLKEFAYRHTATPSFLTRTTEDEGWVRLWGEKGPIEFKRNFLKNAYHLAGQPIVKRLDMYAMDVSRTVTEPRVRFGCGWSPVEVEARVEEGKLYKFVFWDSGGQAASTAEFVCRNLKLKPGQSWSVTVDWKRVK